jgi:hypothetical protein
VAVSKTGTDARPPSDKAVSGNLLFSSLVFAIGAMWTVFVISFGLYEHAPASKPADLAFYVSVAVAIPVAGYVGLRIGQRLALRSTHVLWFTTITFLLITISTIPLHRFSVFLFSLTAVYLVIASVIVFPPRRVSIVMERALTSRSWIANLSAIGAAASFLWLALWNSRPYFYWPNQDPLVVGYDLTKYGPNFNRVLLGTGIALAGIFLIAVSRGYLKAIDWKAKHWPARLFLWILSGTLIGYILICPLPAFEQTHYGAYIGPLYLLRHGGWPLVDVFCQYGLSFLAYSPLGAVLPFNYAAAALVTNLVNIAMLLVALGIIYTLVGDRRFALTVSVTLLIAIWLSLPYNSTYTPSVFGVRWLPTWMLCWLLVRDTTPRRTSARLWALLLLNLASLWSLESHLVAVVMFGLHAALVSRLEGNDLRRAISESIAAVPLSLIGHTLLIAATLIWRGRLPSYGTYFEFMQFYLADGDPDIAFDWLLLARSTIGSNIWLLFVAIYAGLICLAFSSFMLGRSLLVPARLLIGFVTLAVTGTTQLIYFVGRPILAQLAFNALPLYTILICALILFLDHVVDRNGIKHRFAFCAGVLLIAIPAGYAWDRIQMPYNAGFLFGSNNASLLARCIQFSMCNPVHELRLLAESIRRGSPSPIEQPSAKRQIADLVTLYRRWQVQAPDIAMIAPERTPALVRLGVEDALRANNLANDFMSPTLRKHLANSLDRMPPGSLIMTTNPAGPFEIGLLCGLLKRYRFEQVDTTGDVFVDRLVPFDHDFDLGSPVVRTDDKVLLRLRDGSHVPVAPASTGPSAGVVEQFAVRRQTAVISGWIAGASTPDGPKTVVITMHNRIWGIARPGAARSDAAGIELNTQTSGFRLFACDVDHAETADFRAYAWPRSGPATELDYSPRMRAAP